MIRRTTAADGPALAALSALDSAPMPFGPALVAEVGGAPVAALPLDGGRAFGDPFERTNELVALLELRAEQIRRDESDAEQQPARAAPLVGPRGPAPVRLMAADGWSVVSLDDLPTLDARRPPRLEAGPPQPRASRRSA